MYPTVNFNRVVAAICESVMSKHSLTGGKIEVGGDEAAGGGIIVPALQIVPTRFFIVDAAPVAERLVCA